MKKSLKFLSVALCSAVMVTMIPFSVLAESSSNTEISFEQMEFTFDRDNMEGQEEAVELIRRGITAVIVDNDKGSVNKEINLLGVPTDEKIEEIAKQLQVPVRFLGNPSTNKELYIEALEILEDTVQVISFNDYHGTVDEASKNPGMAKFAAAIKSKVEENPNTIVVSSGDSYNGSAMSNLLYGEPMTDLFKEIGLELLALGNHEFDWGVDKIQPWADNGGFEILAANIVYKESGEPVEWATPYSIKEVDGFKIGFIGLATEETAYKTDPENVEDLKFLEVSEVADKYVKELEDKVDAVVLLTHVGSFQDRETKEVYFQDDASGLANVQGVSGIFTGHTHQVVNGLVGDTVVLQGYYNGRTLSELKFIRDEDSNEFVVVGSLDHLYERKDDITPDPIVEAIYNKHNEKVASTLSEKLATLVTALDHETRRELTTLGQWTADLMLRQENADIGVTNAGGLRRSLEQGDVTMGDLFEVMPYDNVHANFEMTGLQVKELFAYGLSEDTIRNIGKLQFSGVVVEVDGFNVVKITLDNGEEIQDDKTYKVVTNDFMASGGDGFTEFKDAKSLGETIPIRDAMVKELLLTPELDYKKVERLIEVDATNEEVVEVVEVVEVEEVVVEKEIYVVKEGDTLSAIALMYKTDWKLLSEINNLENPHLIFVDQKIVIAA